jgi:hypothetical protein
MYLGLRRDKENRNWMPQSRSLPIRVGIGIGALNRFWSISGRNSLKAPIPIVPDQSWGFESILIDLGMRFGLGLGEAISIPFWSKNQIWRSWISITWLFSNLIISMWWPECWFLLRENHFCCDFFDYFTYVNRVGHRKTFGRLLGAASKRFLREGPSSSRFDWQRFARGWWPHGCQGCPSIFQAFDERQMFPPTAICCEEPMEDLRRAWPRLFANRRDDQIVWFIRELFQSSPRGQFFQPERPEKSQKKKSTNMCKGFFENMTFCCVDRFVKR